MNRSRRANEGRRSKGSKFSLAAYGVCMCTFLYAATVGDAHGAETPRELVVRGNRLYNEKKYDKAELLYRDAQKSLPESPEINFNLGNVVYRKGDYDAAEEQFEKVAESADANRELRRKALYNLGNCSFKKGEKLLDSDLGKALDSFKLSILRYHDVIVRDDYGRVQGRGEQFKSDEDAKYNIEVARLRIKDILDKLKQEEERRKQQQKQQQEFVKKLQEAIEKQEEIVKETGEANERKEQGEDVSESAKDLTQRQAENKTRTNELSQQLQRQIEAAQNQAEQAKDSPGGPDENVVSAKNSLNEAEIEEGTAVEHLEREALAEAKGNEEVALGNLQDALAKLTKPQPPQPQPGEQPQRDQQTGKEQQEQKEQQAGEEQEKKQDQDKMTPQEAQEELAKLRQQASKMRERNLQEFLRRRPDYRYDKREYEPVEKDW